MNLDEDLLSAPYQDSASESGEGENNDTTDVIEKPQTSSTFLNLKRTTTKRILVPWTAERKTIELDYFTNHIKHSTPPKRIECEHLKEHKKNMLSNKTWLKIKVFVQNQYIKQNK